METRPIALWAVPRSCSTAFERIFEERGDFEVYHEPFSPAYYYGPERLSNRYRDQEPRERDGYRPALAELLGPSGKPVFFKDIAYHAKGFMGPEFAAHFTNTFLVREPAAVLLSLSRHWPDFTLEETGYEQLYRLFRLAVENGESPPVVDALDLARDPEGTMAAYCARIGVPFMPEALSWEERKVPEREEWERWHEEVEGSTGIESLAERPRGEEHLPAELKEAYEHCRPFYERLSEARLSPLDASEVP